MNKIDENQSAHNSEVLPKSQLRPHWSLSSASGQQRWHNGHMWCHTSQHRDQIESRWRLIKNCNCLHEQNLYCNWNLYHFNYSLLLIASTLANCPAQVSRIQLRCSTSGPLTHLHSERSGFCRPWNFLSVGDLRVQMCPLEKMWHIWASIDEPGRLTWANICVLTAKTIYITC